MADDKKSKAVQATLNAANKAGKVVAVNESKIPNYRFTPPPPAVKKTKKD